MMELGQYREKQLGSVISVFLILLAGIGCTNLALAAGKPYRVAILLPNDEWASSMDGLKEGLKSLGNIEGRDIQYLFENAKGDKNKIIKIAKRYVSEKVDLLFTVTNTALKIVVQETKASKLPVLFGSASGPVESGILPAYVTPNTHVTGVSSGSIELVAKRLEILRELLPKARRVVAIGDADSDSSKMAFAVAREAAARLKISLLERRVLSKDEALEAGKKITLADADAMFLIPGLHGVGALSGLASAAVFNRMPFVVYQVEHVKQSGALLSYGSSYYLEGKQAAVMADKILKNTPVAQIPIERAAVLQLILNNDTAKRIGIKFSREMLNRADEVVGEIKG
jgi:putative ABC transport system substrate-binding protein